MPIKAKYNGSYKDITDLMNVDESIDYVLAKTSSSYKRVYTATRSIEDAPPTTFKSIKSGANLSDYRIYGNTSKNILPLSKTPKTETIGDILCEYDGKGTFTFTSNVDNPTYTQDQWFWVPFEEDFDFPVGISDGGHGCIQLNNDFATGYGVTPYFVGFANRDNGEFVSGFNVAGTALNIVDTNYYTEDLEGLPANCIAFQYLQQIGKRTVTIKPALYLDIRTQQPFEPYGESVGDKTGNLFDIKTFAETCFQHSATVNYTNNTLTFTATGTDAYVNAALSTGVVVPLHYRSSCIDVLPSTTYTISMSSAPKCFISWVDSSFNVVRNYTIIPTNATSYTFTTPENCTKLLIRLGKEVTNIGDTFTISDIMLSVGSTALPYEPYGYKVPVTVSNGTDTLTTPIYLPEPIKMVGDEAEYVDYKEQKQHRVRKNLLQNTAMSKTANGVTITVNADGSVTCNGTASYTTTLYIETLLLPGNYILTGCPSNGSDNTYREDIFYTNNVYIGADHGGGVQFSLSESSNIRVRIRIASDYTCNNLTFYPMIRKADIEDDTYEPYIENTEVDVTLPALPTLPGTNVLSVGTEVQPSKIDITGHIKTIFGGS